MDRQSRNALLASFAQANERAGVDSSIVDLCAAYARQSLKRGETVDYYEPEPTFDQLLTSSAIGAEHKDAIARFRSSNLESGMDPKVISLCIAYAGNLLLQGATVIFDGPQLAGRLGLPYKTLLFLSSNKYKASHGYESLVIPKRRGGVREIDAPRSKLKMVQRWILDNILSGIDLHDAAHGFRSGHSIVTNAEPHVGKQLLIKLDLRDFFPSVSFPRILGLYLDIGYAYNLALLLARLTTYKGRLPQGAPTSPALSNLICRRLDQRLSGLADALEYDYTRYADDITFSAECGKVAPDRMVRIVQKIVAEEGFRCASQKLCTQRKGSRQMVTGLVVNRKVSVPREERRRLRAIIHNCQTRGLQSQNRDDCPHFLERLEGHVAFVMGVDRDQGERLRHALGELPET